MHLQQTGGGNTTSKAMIFGRCHLFFLHAPSAIKVRCSAVVLDSVLCCSSWLYDCMMWQHDVAACCGCMLWLHALAACCGCLQWLLAMAACRGCLSWLHAGNNVFSLPDQDDMLCIGLPGHQLHAAKMALAKM